jgi:hypothetical protein
MDEIEMSFIYQIGIMMEDHPTEEGQHTRHVEITWAAHCLPDHIRQIGLSADNDPLKFKELMEESGGPTILNYRFIRDYTKGVEDGWTINAANHFKLFDPKILP